MRVNRIVTVAGLAMSCIICVAQADDALVESSRIKITGADLEARMQRIPEEYRAEVLGSRARIAKLLEELMVNRALAQKARDEGMDKTPQFRKQVELQEDGMLSKEWLDKQVDALILPSFDARARELYRLDTKKYEIPAQVHAAHILVSTKDRPKEEALARAREIRTKLLQGEAFENLAIEFSDDPSAKTNKGDLGFFEAAKMVKPFSIAAFAMSVPGEISDPVYTSFGYHIIRFIEAKPATTRPYDEVKGEIIDGLRNAFRKEYRQSLIDSAKTDPTLKLNEKEIDKYYVDLEKMQKQSEATAK